MKKLLSLLLVAAMLFSLAACGDDSKGNPVNSGDQPSQGNVPGDSSDSADITKEDIVEGDFTYNTYATALPTNWNPHTWENNSDSAVLGYIETPLVGMQVLDSANGVYQWTYEAATSVEDVTADHQDDLEKYAVNLPEGQSVADTTSGFVFEIKLRDTMKWADGTPINADTYIYSMKQLLAPEMQNYRANLYYSGESAVAGGNAYYNGGRTAMEDNSNVGLTMADFTKDANGKYTTADGTVVIATSEPLAWLGGNSLADYIGAYGEEMFDVASFDALAAQADEDGRVELTDDTLALLVNIITFSPDWGETDAEAVNYLFVPKTYPECDYDETVGCYKVDDYTIRYVCENQIDINYFLTSLTSNWIVYEDLYEANKETKGDKIVTTYGTSPEKSMSYGPYKIESMQEAKEMIYVRNENWYGYEKLDDGYLYSITEFLVDGAHVQRYKTTKVVVRVMTDDAAKMAFMKGEIDDWTPPADEVVDYASSTQIYKVDDTYTMSLFFNCGLDNLKAMDESKGNQNSVVLSNTNFRKAFSLAIDRADWVTSTAGYKPAYALMNNLYFYDVYNDPTSMYRNTEQAMQAVCNLYGVEYGDGTPYADLKEAYQSINGYNLTEAKALMKTACEELVADGLYKEGDPIHIRVGYAAGPLDSSNQSQIAKLNSYINAAAEGSGFGTITLEGIDNLTNRYESVYTGEMAIGYGAWGGAAFYPFRNMQVYCDNSQYDIHEAGCWDPSTEQLTININGQDETMSWKDWSNACVGSGKYANADFDTKLNITATMEEEFLKKYYRIPLAGVTSCSLLSYKQSYYTEDYNIMYGFGGMELLQYNYDDTEWADYVAQQGGTLSYE